MSANKRGSPSDLHEPPEEYYPGRRQKRFDLSSDDWGKFGEAHPTDVEGVFYTEEDIIYQDGDEIAKILEHFDIAVPRTVYPQALEKLEDSAYLTEITSTEFQDLDSGDSGQYHRITGVSQNSP